MKATLDGINLLEQRELTVGSWRRDEVERAVAGLDGAVSIDLGMRSRELVQAGVLWAVSEAKLKQRVDVITLLMDGSGHVLVTGDGRSFANVRIDSFEAGPREYSGRGVSCEFEIRYTQLRG